MAEKKPTPKIVRTRTSTSPTTKTRQVKGKTKVQNPGTTGNRKTADEKAATRKGRERTFKQAEAEGSFTRKTNVDPNWRPKIAPGVNQNDPKVEAQIAKAIRSYRNSHGEVKLEINRQGTATTKSLSMKEMDKAAIESRAKADDLLAEGKGPKNVTETGQERMLRERQEIRDREIRAREREEWRNKKPSTAKAEPKAAEPKATESKPAPAAKKADVKPAAKKAAAPPKAEAKAPAKKAAPPKAEKAPAAKKATAPKKAAAPKATGKKFTQGALPGMSDSAKSVKGGRTAPKATQAAKAEATPAKKSKFVQSTIDDIAEAAKKASKSKVGTALSKIASSQTAKDLLKVAKIGGRATGVVGAALSAKDAIDMAHTDKGRKQYVAMRDAIYSATEGKDRAASAGLANSAPAAKRQQKAVAQQKKFKQEKAKADSAKRTADAVSKIRPGRISTPASADKIETSTKASTAKAAASGSHTVKKGDTLWDIAKSNNTSVDAILKANPTLAKRKAEGKTMLFTNTKVRIPKK